MGDRAWSDGAAPPRRPASSRRWLARPGSTEELLWQTLVALLGRGDRGRRPDPRRVAAYLTKALPRGEAATPRGPTPTSRYEAADRAPGSAPGARRSRGGVRHDRGGRPGAASRRPARASVARPRSCSSSCRPGAARRLPGRRAVSGLSAGRPRQPTPPRLRGRGSSPRAPRAGAAPEGLDDEKQLLVATALRLRREHPEWFLHVSAVYEPLVVSSDHLFGFAVPGVWRWW